MRFLGCVKVVCADCGDEHAMRVHCGPDSIEVAPGDLDNTVRKAFRLMEEKIVKLGWVKRGEWICKPCMETRYGPTPF